MKKYGYLTTGSMPLLAQLLKFGERGEFIKSLHFEGVETCQIDPELVFPEIMMEIKRLNCRVTHFFIGKTNKSIPLHLHNDCGEIYLGGIEENITEVIYSDGSKDSFPMGPDLFTIVKIGDSHGIKLAKEGNKAHFFGIKFEPLLNDGYRYLNIGDIIAAGDEWFNQDWEVGGPWYAVEPGSRFIGSIYKEDFRLMRRRISKEEIDVGA